MEETNSDKDAGVSLLRTISEKGHDLISKFVKGIFYNRKTEDSGKISDDESSTIDENANEMKRNDNQKNDIINKDLDDLFEYDDKDELKDPEKTKQHGNLKIFDDSKAYTCNKPTARMSRTYKI